MARTLEHIAQAAGCTVDAKDPGLSITGAAPFDEAGPGQITLAADKKLVKRIGDTRASAVIVGKDAPPAGVPLLRADNPRLAFARVVGLFFSPPVQAPGVHPAASVGVGFACGDDPSIAPGAVIGNNVTAGHRLTVGPNAVVEDNVVLGDDVIIRANAVIGWGCALGSRVIVHSGAVIGSDGFGYATGEDGRMFKVPQTGTVQIGDDVEIGANCAIDRATFGATVIGNGVKTDNLVHVAHNVTVGEATVLVAQCGISGSTKIGRNCVILGQAGLADHLTVGDFTMVGAQAGVGEDLAGGQMVSGTPAIPHRVWLRVTRLIKRLPDIHNRLKALEKKVRDLEGGHGTSL
ncbi:MAG: UDP-3-O-(3-hydroxymyristoyl)glucosamine N-acyltransferase [Deltaproteobacteria bacterium]|nr:UDP-3-O-(3-hydroxymyristoyl)glucosamine N-acyltransferase [Deltaproteobacteria bacterium]